MSTPTRPRVLIEAEFNPRVKTYWMLSTIIICCVTIVGIPFLLIALPIAYFFGQKYLDRMRCALTERTLIVEKGILNRIETSIPLDKVTDLGLRQGPIMRYLDLHALRVETAGGSGPTGALITLVGIRDGRAFRDAVLEQRDRVTDNAGGGSSGEPRESDSALLAEIRDALLRIESKLDAR